MDIKERIENDFTYHEPDAGKIESHQYIRRCCLQLADDLIHNVPPGREQSLALTKLEEVMMWANAGIARN